MCLRLLFWVNDMWLCCRRCRGSPQTSTLTIWISLTTGIYLYCINVHVWTVCMGYSVTSRGQESGFAFSVQNTDKEVYIEYLPLVAKGYKKLLFSRWKIYSTAASWSHAFIYIQSNIHASAHYSYLFPTVLVNSMTYQCYYSWRYMFVLTGL